MLHLLTKSVNRTWLALLVFVLMLVLLGWLLNPRPSAIVHFPQISPGTSPSIIISPDETLLVITNGNLLHLIYLPTQQTLLTVPYTNDQYGFDSQGHFVWLELQKVIFGLGEGLRLSLWRFEPKMHQKVKLMTRHHRMVYEGGPDTTFKGLHRLGLYREHALLSPDCKTLLVSNYSATIASFELIDVETGATRAPLEITPIQLKDCYTLLVEAEFSLDGQSLLIQIEDREGANTHYRLRLFNTNTGKEISTFQMPGVETLGAGSSAGWGGYYHGFDRTSEIWHNETRLGSAIQFDKDRIICHLNNNYQENTNGIMLIDFSTQSVIKERLNEHHLSPVEEIQYGKTEGKEIRSKKTCRSFVTKNAIFSFAQYQESKPSDWREGDRSLPVLSFSIRKVNDGQLLHTSKYAEEQNPNQCDLDPTVMLNLLPDGRAVFIQDTWSAPRKSKFKEWADKIREWLHLPIQRELYVIDTQTGFCEYTLSTKGDMHSAHLLSDDHSLAITGSDNDGLFLMKYDYPLHKPWLLIFTWAIGLAVIVLVFCEGYLALRRRKHRPSTQ